VEAAKDDFEDFLRALPLGVKTIFLWLSDSGNGFFELFS
jgi:hypothetical protein